MFWQGLLDFIREATELYRNRGNFDLLVSNYLPMGNSEKNMNLVNLIYFLKKRQVFVEENELKKILKRLNYAADQNFILNRDMLKALLKELLHHNEIIDIFLNYCKNWLENDQEAEYYMTFEELKNFFIVEQKQIFDDATIKNMIITFEDKRGEQKTDQISLIGFRNILFSMNNQICDVNQLDFYQVFCFLYKKIRK